MLGIVLIGLYFSTAASMALAPFMFIGHPDKNPLKVLKESSVCMKGKKLEFIRLILSFVPAMLPVVTIPFVIPSAVMAAAVFAQKKVPIQTYPEGTVINYAVKNRAELYF